MRKEKETDFIEIQEDVRLPNSDVILEKGDNIKIIQEMADDEHPDEEKVRNRVLKILEPHVVQRIHYYKYPQLEIHFKDVGFQLNQKEIEAISKVVNLPLDHISTFGTSGIGLVFSK